MADIGSAPLRGGNGQLSDAIVEEYRSLRTEAISARDAQLSVLRFGVTILGAVAGVAVTQREDQVLSGVLLAGVAPFIALFTLEVWVAEVERSVRAGAFIASIERRLAQYEPARRPPMGWENWLRRSRDWSKAKVIRIGFGSEQNRASFYRGAWIVVFLVTVYAVCCFGGAHYLHNSDRAAYNAFLIGDAAGFVLMLVRVVFVFRGIRNRDQPPPLDQAWPVGGWDEPEVKSD